MNINVIKVTMVIHLNYGYGIDSGEQCNIWFKKQIVTLSIL